MKMMVRSAFMICMLGSSLSWGSQGFSKADAILKDHLQAKTFAGFIEKLTRFSVPGDYDFMKKIIAANRAWEKPGSLQKLTFDNGTFTIKNASKSKKPDFSAGISVKVLEDSEGTYVINGHDVEFSIIDLPTQKLEKIRKALNARKAAYWLLVRTADAIIGVSKEEATIFSIVSIYEQKRGSQHDTSSLDRYRDSLGSCLNSVSELGRAIQSHSLPVHKLSCSSEGLRLTLFSNPTQTASLIIPSGDKFSFETIDGGGAPFSKSYSKGNGGVFKQMAGEDVNSLEFIARFGPVAEDPKIAEFCQSTCGKPLTEYYQKVTGSAVTDSSKPAAGKR